ncbi:hypothetical protein M8J75_015697 [Diaphorina citri]|nr:hypothetical protein M8J75_015697 [Diaphorina citri]
MYGGVQYEEGMTVPTEEHCLNCSCTRGSLVCHLRICPTLPDPPPRGCLIVHKAQKCCPQLICEHGFYEDLNNSIEARSGMMSLPEMNETSKGCIINGTLYAEGSATDTSSLCQYCYCIRGAQHCVKPKCLLNTPGCSPVYNKLTCCPTKYNCTASKPSGSLTVDGGEGQTNLQLLAANKGCSIDGKHYLEGDKVDGITNSSCVNCYCIAGKITCEQIICTPPVKHNCKPVYHVKHCCPISYDCKQNTIIANNTTSQNVISTTLKEEFHTGRDEFNLEFYANISTVNINKNTLDTDIDNVENRISKDEVDLNKSQEKTPSESFKSSLQEKTTSESFKSSPKVSNSTRDNLVKLQNNKLNSIQGATKTMVKRNNDSSTAVHMTNTVNTKTSGVNLSNKAGGNKVLVNTTRNNVISKTQNKTSIMNNKMKPLTNSSKTAQVMNKLGNKVVTQALVNTSSKTINVPNIQGNKTRTNSTVNNLSKINDKNVIPLKVNQSGIIKPNEQLTKNKPNRLQGIAIKNNSSSNSTSTKEYIKVPTKTVSSNKTTANNSSVASTNYQKISSSNDVTKVENVTLKTEVHTAAAVNRTTIENKTSTNKVNETHQEIALDKVILKTNETVTQIKKKDGNESVILERNHTKTSDQKFEAQRDNSSTIIKQDEKLNGDNSATEIPDFDDSTSVDDIPNDIVKNKEIKNDTDLITNEEGKNENETILERTKTGSIDSAEESGGSSNVTAGSTVRAAMSNKSVDVEYDYNEDSLPPSLPNLNIIPFVAADAVVDETNIFKQREDTESIIAITENPSYLDPFSNFFSPPVRTEGGFVPKEPILDGPYFESKIETSPQPPPRAPVSTESVIALLSDTSTHGIAPDMAVAPLITFTEPTPDKIIESDYHCLFSSKVYKHGELVSHIDDCRVCVCFYGDIACQEPKCPEVSAGCRRVDSHGGCCGRIECDSNDIISSHIKDRFDEDAHINATNSDNQHRIEYIHLSEHQVNPVTADANIGHEVPEHSDKNVDDKFTTTEEPNVEYISNNKYVIVKPTPNKQKHQTTTYKSILDDLLPYLWESEDENDVNKGKTTNSTQENGYVHKETQDKVSVHNTHNSSEVLDDHDQFNNQGSQISSTSEKNHHSNIEIPNKNKEANENNHNTENKTKNPNKGENEENLFSSLLHSFSTMYSSLDNTKHKPKPGTSRPVNKNNVRIKPVVPHNPPVKKTTNEQFAYQQNHIHLGTFSTSTIKTTTLFIPILRYNSTATKYYSVLETTPVLSEKKVSQNRVPEYEDLVEEAPNTAKPEKYNRVTQPPQNKYVMHSTKNKLGITTTPETFWVTPKNDPNPTTHGYFGPSESYSPIDQISQFTSTIRNQIPNRVVQANKDDLYGFQPLTSTTHQNDIRVTADIEKTTVVSQVSPLDKGAVSEQNYGTKLETYTKAQPVDSNNKKNENPKPENSTISGVGTTLKGEELNKVTQTTEPDLFGDLLGNLFGDNDQISQTTIVTKQETTTKAPIIKSTTKKPETSIKDDYDDSFSLDSVLSYWFNSDAETTSSTTTMNPNNRIESRIDTDVDDTDDDDMYEDDEDLEEDFNEDKNTAKNPVKKDKESIRGKEEVTVLPNKLEGAEKIQNNTKEDTQNNTILQNRTNAILSENATESRNDIKTGDKHVSSRPNEMEKYNTSNKSNTFNQQTLDKSDGKIDKPNLNGSNVDTKRENEQTADKNTTEDKSAEPPQENFVKDSTVKAPSSISPEIVSRYGSNETVANKTPENDTKRRENPKPVAENPIVQTRKTTESFASTTEENVIKSHQYEHKNVATHYNRVPPNKNQPLKPAQQMHDLHTPMNDHDRHTPIHDHDLHKPIHDHDLHTPIVDEPSTEAFVPIQTVTRPTVQTQTHQNTRPPYKFSTTKPTFTPGSLSTPKRFLPTKRPYSYRPSTYRPKVKFSLPPRTSPRPTSPSSTAGLNLLKIDECNIYGSIYKVGSSIGELSTECMHCLCTSMGVQCSTRC